MTEEPVTPPLSGPSRRMIAILECAADGCTKQETAERLGIKEQTVMDDLKRLHRSLPARRTAQAVAIAFRRGWLQ